MDIITRPDEIFFIEHPIEIIEVLSIYNYQCSVPHLSSHHKTVFCFEVVLC